MDSRRTRVLLVDDDEDDYIITRELLSSIDGGSFALDWVSTYTAAADTVARNQHDVYIVDYRLRDGSGLELVRESLREGCRAPMILLTGQGDHEVDETAMKVGAADYLVKGQITAPLLKRSIRHAIERSHALEALRRSEERFRLLIENSYDMLTILESDGTVRYHSPSLGRVLGYAQDMLIGKKFFEYVHPADQSGAVATFKSMLTIEGFSPPTEFRLLHSDGSWHFFESVANNLSQDPVIAGIVLNSRDITERKQAEEELRKSQTRLAKAQQIAHVGNWELDLVTGELIWSDELHRIFGSAPGGPVDSERFWRTVHPDDHALVRSIYEEASAHRKPYSVDHRIILPNGTERIVSEQAEFIFDEYGVAVKVIGTVQDITDRKRMEEALRRSELQYRNLYENAIDPILIFEPEHEIILEVNNQACETYGFRREEFIGMSLKKITKDVGRGEQQIYKLMRNRTFRNFETVHFRKDGAAIDILASSAVIEYDGKEAVLSIHRDVTERKRLQQQLIQSEKMAALGQLVSGVAHELNNPLTSVIGYTQLVYQSDSLDEQARERLGIVTREAERTRRIVSNLLSFARQHKPARVEVDINELLERTLELRAYEMRVSNILVETDLHSIPKVCGDDHQLQQVFMNIIINAEQAIRDNKKEGKLRITSEVSRNDQPKVVVKISDDGPGILPQHVEKVFDPFFSTKPIGKGTGLGLSITYGIVKEHGGGVTAENNRNGGATFTVELPVDSARYL